MDLAKFVALAKNPRRRAKPKPERKPRNLKPARVLANAPAYDAAATEAAVQALMPHSPV